MIVLVVLFMHAFPKEKILVEISERGSYPEEDASRSTSYVVVLKSNLPKIFVSLIINNLYQLQSISDTTTVK